MEKFFVTKAEFNKFIADLSKEYRCFVPQKINAEDYAVVPFTKDPAPEIIFNEYRCVETLKPFFSFAREEVAQYFNKDYKSEVTPACLVGVKACDLFSLKIQDFVFKQGDVSDPSYCERRKNTLIISSDCTGFKEVCFCLALKILPHPIELFDINLSPINEGYVAKAGSRLGEETIKSHAKYFKPSNSGQFTAVKSKRQRLIDDLNRHLEAQQLANPDVIHKAMKQGYNNIDYWQETVLTCVECGACNFICCTCHCFLLTDVKSGFEAKRFRIWDSCQYLNFARVAGGANPLKRRRERLRNRFMKKFDFFPDVLGLYACTGCGRCIEACPAKIDIRKVLKDITHEYEHKKSLSAD